MKWDCDYVWKVEACKDSTRCSIILIFPWSSHSSDTVISYVFITKPLSAISCIFYISQSNLIIRRLENVFHNDIPKNLKSFPSAPWWHPLMHVWGLRWAKTNLDCNGKILHAIFKNIGRHVIWRSFFILLCLTRSNGLDKSCCFDMQCNNKILEQHFNNGYSSSSFRPTMYK